MPTVVSIDVLLAHGNLEVCVGHALKLPLDTEVQLGLGSDPQPSHRNCEFTLAAGFGTSLDEQLIDLLLFGAVARKILKGVYVLPVEKGDVNWGDWQYKCFGTRVCSRPQ